MELRETIREKNKTFSYVARAQSDDPETKVNGGKINWQHREYLKGSRDQRAPKEVLAAAFKLPIGTVSAVYD